MARALEVPMYRSFHDVSPTSLLKVKPAKDDEFGNRGKEAAYSRNSAGYLGK